MCTHPTVCFCRMQKTYESVPVVTHPRLMYTRRRHLYARKGRVLLASTGRVSFITILQFLHFYARIQPNLVSLRCFRPGVSSETFSLNSRVQSRGS
jgi:hypothetical protein